FFFFFFINENMTKTQCAASANSYYMFNIPDMMKQSNSGSNPLEKRDVLWSPTNGSKGSLMTMSRDAMANTSMHENPFTAMLNEGQRKHSVVSTQSMREADDAMSTISALSIAKDVEQVCEWHQSYFRGCNVYLSKTQLQFCTRVDLDGECSFLSDTLLHLLQQYERMQTKNIVQLTNGKQQSSLQDFQPFEEKESDEER
ncbi:hypothetical protein RFI_33238, partial [Reticulomyxa filosa]